MSCCNAANDFFDETMAQRDLRRYHKRGPLQSSQRLLRSLGPVTNQSILDIGSGIGAVTHGVLSSGARQVTAVDASSAYLRHLREEAQRQGHKDRIETHFGDFTVLAGDLEPCDVATLDRVLCCYEHVDVLLKHVAQLTRLRIGLVFPRATWWSRMGIRFFNLIQEIRGHTFRVFFHSPDRVSELLGSANFREMATDRTLIWRIAVYERI